MYQRMSAASVRAGALAAANERRGVFELYFAVLGPGERRRTVRKGLGFPMDDLLVHTLAHDRGVADRAVRLPACLDRCHDAEFGGDKPILSPLCLLRKR